MLCAKLASKANIQQYVRNKQLHKLMDEAFKQGFRDRFHTVFPQKLITKGRDGKEYIGITFRGPNTPDSMPAVFVKEGATQYEARVLTDLNRCVCWEDDFTDAKSVVRVMQQVVDAVEAVERWKADNEGSVSSVEHGRNANSTVSSIAMESTGVGTELSEPPGLTSRLSPPGLSSLELARQSTMLPQKIRTVIWLASLEKFSWRACVFWLIVIGIFFCVHFAAVHGVTAMHWLSYFLYAIVPPGFIHIYSWFRYKLHFSRCERVFDILDTEYQSKVQGRLCTSWFISMIIDVLGTLVGIGLGVWRVLENLPDTILNYYWFYILSALVTAENIAYGVLITLGTISPFFCCRLAQAYVRTGTLDWQNFQSNITTINKSASELGIVLLVCCSVFMVFNVSWFFGGLELQFFAPGGWGLIWPRPKDFGLRVTALIFKSTPWVVIPMCVMYAWMWPVMEKEKRLATLEGQDRRKFAKVDVRVSFCCFYFSSRKHAVGFWIVYEALTAGIAFGLANAQ